MQRCQGLPFCLCLQHLVCIKKTVTRGLCKAFKPEALFLYLVRLFPDCSGATLSALLTAAVVPRGGVGEGRDVVATPRGHLVVSGDSLVVITCVCVGGGGGRSGRMLMASSSRRQGSC